MSRHRLDVEPLARPTDPVTPDEALVYVGKRRAPVPSTPEPPAPAAPSSYVGKRRAAVPAETSETSETSETIGAVVADRPVPTTAELYAIVERTLEETAPRPRMTQEMLDSVEAPSLVPTPRRSAEEPVGLVEPSLAPAPLDMPVGGDDTAIALPRVDPAVNPLQASLSDTAIALPRVTLADNLDHDLLAQTASIEAVAAGRRRRNAGQRRTLRGLPSLPLAAGLAALAVAVTGVVTTGHQVIDPASARTVVQASALGGTTGSDVVGARGPALSRDADRTRIAHTAAQRTLALTKTGKQAGSYDAYLKKNEWGLPILAGEYHLTARFGDVSGLWHTIHTGLDFACPTGTPIHAVASGKITQTGWAGSYGNLTVETLPDGTELWYAHQSAFGSHVGEKVTEGEVIGYVGSTGNTTGPHVHLEVRPGGGDPVDPDAALRAHGIDPDAHQS